MISAKTIIAAFVVSVLGAWMISSRPVVEAQSSVMVYDYGRVCLYVTSSGGIWGVMKSDFGWTGSSLDWPCPEQRGRR